MNLIFRLLAICVQYLFDHRQIHIADKSEIYSRVWPTDLDSNIHMNNGRYLSIMDLGRLDLMVRLGLMRHVLRQKWMPVLSAATIRYRLSLNPFQKFRLDTKIAWWDDKWFYIEQRFIICGGQKDGVVAAISFVKGSFYSKKTKSTIPTQDLISLLHLNDTDIPEQPAFVKSWQIAENDLRDLTKEALDQ